MPSLSPPRVRAAVLLLPMALLVAALGVACNDDADAGRDSPADVVSSFMGNLRAGAPPNADEGASTNALALLSERARQQIGVDEGSDTPVATQIALSIGLQDLPSEVNIESDTSTETEAVVVAELDYGSSDNAIRTFFLVEEGGEWRIDRVEQ